MAYLLFVDESGHDRRASPFEVLAGAAVHDSRVWDLICDIQEEEERCFGQRMFAHRGEMKAKNLLKRKTFRLANQRSPLPEDECSALAHALLRDPGNPTRDRLTALGQAKVRFAQRVLELCMAHGVRLFASAVPAMAPRSSLDGLRKDYAYLLERFYYFIEGQAEAERGLVVFDEYDRSRSHLLTDQLSAYFRGTRPGRLRAGRIIPEPLFVHSELTTGVQIADLVAYLLAWNVRVGSMEGDVRPELDHLGQLVLQMRHRAIVEREGYPAGFNVWSFAVIDDLRPQSEQQGSFLDRLK